ncbi:MAG: DUF4907 domain-containing protein [Bacteroidota bacterium]|nr:DUF4907 domain-containing protein [Bacteroidota bacterium]
MPATKNLFCKITFAIILFTAFNASAQSKKRKLINNAVHTTSVNNPYTYIITGSTQNTFGYNILDHGKVIIRQPNIPAVPGNKSFTSKHDAERTAQLAIIKISHGIMPPTISIHELDSMHININNKK